MERGATERWGTARACLLAVLCAALAALGHLAGGGALPDLAVLLVPLPLLAAGFTVLAGRSRGAVGTVAVLGCGQLAMHGLVELLSPDHAGHPVAPATTAATPGTGMVIGHAVATLLTAAALRYAERTIALLGAALRRILPRRPPVLAADRPLATLATPGPAVALRLARALATGHIRRGPPVGC